MAYALTTPHNHPTLDITRALECVLLKNMHVRYTAFPAFNSDFGTVNPAIGYRLYAHVVHKAFVVLTTSRTQHHWEIVWKAMSCPSLLVHVAIMFGCKIDFVEGLILDMISRARCLCRLLFSMIATAASNDLSSTITHLSTRISRLLGAALKKSRPVNSSDFKGRDGLGENRDVVLGSDLGLDGAANVVAGGYYEAPWSAPTTFPRFHTQQQLAAYPLNVLYDAALTSRIELMDWKTDDAQATQRAGRIFLSYVASHYIARRTPSTHLHLSSSLHAALSEDFAHAQLLRRGNMSFKTISGQREPDVLLAYLFRVLVGLHFAAGKDPTYERTRSYVG